MAISIYRNLFLKKLWPDFNNKDLINIIKKFQTIKRNFGGI
jgi:undecaprenyl pyrophosphate synthase